MDACRCRRRRRQVLCGIPQAQGEIARELTTPTGAALLAELSAGDGAQPEGFSLRAYSYGAGGWDLPQPNVLRLCLGTLAEKLAGRTLFY